MSEQPAIINLQVRKSAESSGRTFLYHIQVDGETVASNRGLSASEAKAMREFSRRYNELFERRPKPGISLDALGALGAELFDTWLSGSWEQITKKIRKGTRRLLVISSDVAEILNLPWELLRFPDGDFLGFDAKFSVRRLPWLEPPLSHFTGELRPRPLRILFMACAPRDERELDYEREEQFLVKAIAASGPNVAFDLGDMGTFEELRQRINEFQPHVVHLTGHGKVERDGLGYFAFEDERGQSDRRSSVEIRRDLFAGSGVQLVFVSGCQTGKAPPVAVLGGICQGLVCEEVPLAIGWAASIRDDIATLFAGTLYNTLASGQPVDRALTQARQAIRKLCEECGDPSWMLPVLYAATTQDLVFDIDPARPISPPVRKSVPQQPLSGMSEGYAESFVGRRRETQRLLPHLREGSLRAVLLTGLGGAGKSTLATRLARRLEADHFTPIPVPSSEENPLSASRLLQACGDAFLAAGMRDAYGVLRDADLPVDDRLRQIVAALNGSRFTLVMDNFEVNMDETTRRILDPALAGFYTYLLANLSGGSRAIITCRYPPADMPALPSTVCEECLGDFSKSSFFKFLLRDPVVEQHYSRGKLPHDLLSALHELLGGTPRFLAQIREALKTMSAGDLQRELDAVKLPKGGQPGVLQEARDSYCEQIFTSRLYGYLGRDSQKALSRAAVYGIPVNLAALAAVTAEPLEKLRGFTREWQDYALAYFEQDSGHGELWTVYGLLRGWLLAPERLDSDERRAAHQAAGDFLRDLELRDRERELGLSWIDCLMEARVQYLASGDYEQARAVTDCISGTLVTRGLYDELVRLNEGLLAYEEHPSPMSWIARGYVDRGDYHRARDWYSRCLAAAGDAVLREAAVAWHGLATIDVNVGDYEAAREKFERSLKIEQEIGNRAGEAATFYQLGFLAGEVGALAAGVRLVALCFLIDQSIGHGDAESDLKAVAGMASRLDYTPQEVAAMLEGVKDEYVKDRGWGLVRAAFPEG